MVHNGVPEIDIKFTLKWSYSKHGSWLILYFSPTIDPVPPKLIFMSLWGIVPLSTPCNSDYDLFHICCMSVITASSRIGFCHLLCIYTSCQSLICGQQSPVIFEMYPKSLALGPSQCSCRHLSKASSNGPFSFWLFSEANENSVKTF